MIFSLKWVHMARYELILRLDRALWLRIIFKPLLTTQRAITITENYPNNWLGSRWDNFRHPFDTCDLTLLDKNRSKGPCDVFDPWVRWERGQVGI